MLECLVYKKRQKYAETQGQCVWIVEHSCKYKKSILNANL